METTTEVLEDLARASKTFKGGTMLLESNREKIVAEMKIFLYTSREAKERGATPFEIQEASAGRFVKHYLD